jgi:hypothetical protein
MDDGESISEKALEFGVATELGLRRGIAGVEAAQRKD